MSAPQPGRDLAAVIALVAAVVLHLIVGVLHLTIGLVAPGWAVIALNIEWLAMAALLWRWRRRPAPLLAVPFISAAILLTTVMLGDRLLGWTA